DLKRTLVRHQTPADIAVLNLDNPVTAGFREDTAAETLFFSMRGDLPGDGAFLRNERVIWRRNGAEAVVLEVSEVPLRGRHNLENVLAATAVAGACSIPMETVRDTVRAFRGVPHRLEIAGVAGGVTYVNDSIATAPERTLAGMRSFHEPLILLLGGRDKHLPLEEMAAEAAHHCRAAICFGEAGDLFADAIRAAATDPSTQILRVDTLDAAVTRAAAIAQPGDVVLLAPAGTSFDAYPNFERRGEHFRRLVQEMQTLVGARLIAPAPLTTPEAHTTGQGRDESRPYGPANALGDAKDDAP
ncbi:MAG: glutamate ligase domain-containing protein, partial [Dehalococcoidia bacterium]